MVRARRASSWPRATRRPRPVPARLGLRHRAGGRYPDERRRGDDLRHPADGVAAAECGWRAALTARLKGRDLEADLSLPEAGVALAAAGRLAPGGAIVTRLRIHDGTGGSP
jgi:hypothetical protein